MDSSLSVALILFRNDTMIIVVNSILTGLFLVLQSEIVLQYVRMEGEPEGHASEADFPEHLGARARSSILTPPLYFFSSCYGISLAY